VLTTLVTNNFLHFPLSFILWKSSWSYYKFISPPLFSQKAQIRSYNRYRLDLLHKHKRLWQFAHRLTWFQRLVLLLLPRYGRELQHNVHHRFDHSHLVLDHLDMHPHPYCLLSQQDKQQSTFTLRVHSVPWNKATCWQMWEIHLPIHRCERCEKRWCEARMG